MKHKYPIGTRIRYIGFIREDVGKIGKIVGYVNEDTVWIVVPNSYIALELYGYSEHKWSTWLTNVELLVIPNQQLEFDFMKG